MDQRPQGQKAAEMVYRASYHGRIRNPCYAFGTRDLQLANGDQ